MLSSWSVHALGFAKNTEASDLHPWFVLLATWMPSLPFFVGNIHQLWGRCWISLHQSEQEKGAVPRGHTKTVYFQLLTAATKPLSDWQEGFLLPQS